MEDDRHRLADRQATDAQRDRHRRAVVEQRAAKQLLSRALVSILLLAGHLFRCGRGVAGPNYSLQSGVINQLANG